MDNLNKAMVDVYSVNCDAMANIEYVENLLNN